MVMKAIPPLRGKKNLGKANKHIYLCQGGYEVMFVCLFVSKNTKQRIPHGVTSTFSKVAGSWCNIELI